MQVPGAAGTGQPRGWEEADWRELYELHRLSEDEKRRAVGQRLRGMWAAEAQQRSSRSIQVPPDPPCFVGRAPGVAAAARNWGGHAPAQGLHADRAPQQRTCAATAASPARTAPPGRTGCAGGSTRQWWARQRQLMTSADDCSLPWVARRGCS